MLRLIKTNQKNFLLKLSFILDKRKSESSNIDSKIKYIIQDIKKNGDLALIKYEKKFSKFKNISRNNIKFTKEEENQVIKKKNKKTKSSIDLAFNRILNFHKKQKLSSFSFIDQFKNSFSYKSNAINKVGVYVPGGLASYPSSVLMNCIPAIVAGVKNIYMTTPSMDGYYSPAVIYAARKCKVKEIYKIGGAQAIAAMAYGTKTISKVDKIVGPGNAYVATAKKQVFGDVGIDMIAGPSEVTIVADKWSKPDWVAADLIAQAEHDENSQSIVISDDAKMINKIKVKQCAVVTNSLMPTYPEGLDVTVLSFNALNEAWQSANLQSQREHVTPYVFDPSNGFDIYHFQQKDDRSDLRWTVDYKEDFLFVKTIYECLYIQDESFSTGDIYNLLQEIPSLQIMNSQYVRNAGLINSLKNDIKVK